MAQNIPGAALRMRRMAPERIPTGTSRVSRGTSSTHAAPTVCIRECVTECVTEGVGMTSYCFTCGATRYVRRADRRTCSHCGTAVCVRHTFIRVDEANAAITRSSPLFCARCADELEPRYV